MCLIRQKRIPFPFNNHFCQNLFDLIHCDVWGPYSISTQDAYKYFLTIVNDHTKVYLGLTYEIQVRHQIPYTIFLSNDLDTIYSQH